MVSFSLIFGCITPSEIGSFFVEVDGHRRIDKSSDHRIVNLICHNTVHHLYAVEESRSARYCIMQQNTIYRSSSRCKNFGVDRTENRWIERDPKHVGSESGFAESCYL